MVWISKKKMENRLQLFVFIVLIVFSSCENTNSTYKVGKRNSIKLVSDYGEISIELSENSVKIKHMEIIDKTENNEIYHEFLENGLIKNKIIKSGKESMEVREYISFSPDGHSSFVNDTLIKETSYQLLKTNIYRINGSILYAETYQNGKKLENSLKLNLIKSGLTEGDSLFLVVENDFPFNGELKFYYPKTKNSIQTEKIRENLYLLAFPGFTKKEDKIKFDVELIPSEKDTLIHSVYGQEFFLKWE